MNLSGRYERIHKCCRCCRIYYADYIIDENVMLENLAKNLSQDELDWLLQNHTKLCLRVNHHLFEYDDLARSVFFKSKKRALAVKIYKIAQSFCKSGMDYAFLAIAIHKSLRAKKWCKELLAMAENNIKDWLCLINMLNFIEIKVLFGQKAKNFLQNALTATDFKADFYLDMALELKQIGGFDEFAYKFYKKCIEKNKHDFYLSYAHVFIKDKGELKAYIADKPISEFVSEWAQKDGKAFIAAPQGQGGGAGGSNNTASAGTKWGGSREERIAAINEKFNLKE